MSSMEAAPCSSAHFMAGSRYFDSRALSRNFSKSALKFSSSAPTSPTAVKPYKSFKDLMRRSAPQWEFSTTPETSVRRRTSANSSQDLAVCVTIFMYSILASVSSGSPSQPLAKAHTGGRSIMSGVVYRPPPDFGRYCVFAQTYSASVSQKTTMPVLMMSWFSLRRMALSPMTIPMGWLASGRAANCLMISVSFSRYSSSFSMYRSVGAILELEDSFLSEFHSVHSKPPYFPCSWSRSQNQVPSAAWTYDKALKSDSNTSSPMLPFWPTK
mmetsp:Transcript_104360/g.300163  ORF Transcript_104360/g.300163 Transcript_104360/m.300163 type:complete len:270 (-) Transcript_104360:447-1256(-)